MQIREMAARALRDKRKREQEKLERASTGRVHDARQKIVSFFGLGMDDYEDVVPIAVYGDWTLVKVQGLHIYVSRTDNHFRVGVICDKCNDHHAGVGSDFWNLTELGVILEAEVQPPNCHAT